MKKAAEIISAIFIPLLSPTYLCLIILIFVPAISPYQSIGEKTLAVVCILLATCLPPFLLVYILYKRKVISSLTLEKRSDRYIPLAFGCANYIAIYILLVYKFGGHHVFSLTMLATTITLCIITVITQFWKISTHAAGVFGLIAILNVITRYHPSNGFMIVYYSLAVATILTCLARLYLRVHTLMQVIAGSALALIVVAVVFHSLG